MGAIRTGLLALAAICLFGGRAAADRSGPEVVRPGHWLEVRGRMERDGRFHGERAEILHPKKRGLLLGTISQADPDGDTFTLLGKRVRTTSRTEWEGLTPGAAAGRRVKVRGYHRGRRELLAREIATRDPGLDRIGGRVDSVRGTGAGIEVSILRVRVLLPAEIEHDDPLAEIPLAPTRLDIERQAKSEDDLFGRGVVLASDLRLFGQVETRSAAEENFDLEAEDDEDRVDNSGRLRLRFEWDPSPRFGAVVEGRHRTRYRADEKDGDDRTSDTFLGETFVSYHGSPSPVGVTVLAGRQDFDDRREWIYDQNLDGVRLLYLWAAWRLEASVSTTLADGSRRDEASTNYIAYLRRGGRKRHVALWGIRREVDLEEEETWNHLGLRALGKAGWLDLAFFFGREGNVDATGWGLDVGTTRPLGSSPFSVTLAYAHGSGGAPSDERDRTFRQTGYQDNNGRFNGVTSFRYYGELLDPELANLQISTVGIGWLLAERSSLDVVAHHYRQDEPRRRLVEAQIDRRPDGIHDDLGWEIDAILGVRRAWSWDLEVVVAVFHPGEAFQDRDDALLARLQLRYRF